MCPKVENFLKNALKQFWPLLCLSRTGPWTVDTVSIFTQIITEMTVMIVITKTMLMMMCLIVKMPACETVCGVWVGRGPCQLGVAALNEADPGFHHHRHRHGAVTKSPKTVTSSGLFVSRTWENSSPPNALVFQELCSISYPPLSPTAHMTSVAQRGGNLSVSIFKRSWRRTHISWVRRQSLWSPRPVHGTYFDQ